MVLFVANVVYLSLYGVVGVIGRCWWWGITKMKQAAPVLVYGKVSRETFGFVG
jgi:hypothetical protein